MIIAGLRETKVQIDLSQYLTQYHENSHHFRITNVTEVVCTPLTRLRLVAGQAQLSGTSHQERQVDTEDDTDINVPATEGT
ncbi:hypothetical protein K443DRAFT_271112 [Laccaria amethystina LaAM-08-1]|jgi:hypothetical protein|uniref:Uncharacterized protein n=1 Tax=Laccaria amethystina LaAM-08-1 TaxID=1095629 RepID=A0A0C9WWA8_9AGAR|nr:hypothetical protein K443DRAFT_271112 [Laccaria amethystina LaAM-08-1]